MAFTDDHVPLPVTHTTAPVYNRWALTNTDPSNLVKPDGYRRDSAFFGLLAAQVVPQITAR